MDATPPLPLRGVLAALPTPFDAAGALAPAAVGPLLDLAAGSGCHGALLAGSTGEGPSLTLDERIALVAAAARWRAARPIDAPPFLILCGTGHPAWPDAAHATAAAVAAGADAAVVVPPYYFKGVDDGGLIDWYRRVVDGAGDRLAQGAAAPRSGSDSSDGIEGPRIPRPRILLYDIPRHTGVPIPNAVLRALVDGYGPHGPIVGLKDSTADRDATLHRIRALPELAIFTGTDSHLSEVLAAGGAGAITALASVRGDLLRRVWASAMTAADDPRTAQAALDAARDALDARPAVAALKAALALRLGGDTWHARPPLVDLPAADGRAFSQALAQIGAAVDAAAGQG
ncbi:MAG: dihydrodipicolinate synthase family protein [Ardenticatenales bacterium]|nr:dihydrodipicolinate synthase family protein [Ardenticatenales bacterium]